MKIYPPFPTCREATPTRRAEKLIYETLEASELDGLALYEVKPLSSAPQLDFAVWLLDIGTFGIQGKGGQVHHHRRRVVPGHRPGPDPQGVADPRDVGRRHGHP